VTVMSNPSLPAPDPYPTAKIRFPGFAMSRIAHRPTMIAALYVFLNLCADVATILVSPRLRTSLE